MFARTLPGLVGGQNNPYFRPIYTATVSGAQATVDVDNTAIDWTYWDSVIIKFRRVTVVNDDVQIRGRVYDTTLGAWQADASDYKWRVVNNNSTSTGGNDHTAGLTTALALSGESAAGNGVGNAAAEFFDCVVTIDNPSNTSHVKLIKWESVWVDTSTVIARASGGGAYATTVNAISGFRILAESGNIDGAQVDVWGVRAL